MNKFFSSFIPKWGNTPISTKMSLTDAFRKRLEKIRQKKFHREIKGGEEKEEIKQP